MDDVLIVGAGPVGLMRLLLISLQHGVLIAGVREKGAPGDGPVTAEDFRAAMRRVLGQDLPLGEPIWLSGTVARPSSGSGLQPAGLDQARFVGDHHELGAVAGVQLHHGPAHVRLGRRR